jgi:hypothetical protein
VRPKAKGALNAANTKEAGERALEAFEALTSLLLADGPYEEWLDE